MSGSFRLFIMICGLSFFGAVIILMMKKRLSERNAIIWMIGAIVILILSAQPGIINIVSELVGVDYPPSLLFLFSTFVLLFLALHHSIQISILDARLKELTQIVAISDFLYTKRKNNKRCKEGRENDENIKGDGEIN